MANTITGSCRLVDGAVHSYRTRRRTEGGAAGTHDFEIYYPEAHLQWLGFGVFAVTASAAVELMDNITNGPVVLTRNDGAGPSFEVIPT